MSESLVVACDLEETVAEVLTQLVQDGGEMPVELLQEQVELHLEYSEGSLSNWQNLTSCFLFIRYIYIYAYVCMCVCVCVCVCVYVGLGDTFSVH